MIIFSILNFVVKALVTVDVIFLDEPFAPGSVVVSTLKQALKKYQKDVVEDRCKIIDVDRAILWKQLLCSIRVLLRNICIVS